MAKTVRPQAEENPPMATHCPLCGVSDYEFVFAARDMFGGKLYPLWRCRKCLLVATETSAPNQNTGVVVSDYTYGGELDAGKRFPGLIEKLERFLRRGRVAIVEGAYADSRRILDVGCGRGVMLTELGKRGWQVWGTEIDGKIAAFARLKLGQRIYLGTLEKLALKPQSFDVITLWHVLEHTANPLSTLKTAYELLAPGGALIVAVPNFNSWQAGWFGPHWLHLDVPRHFWHFDVAIIKDLAARCGFSWRKTFHFSFEYGPYGMLQSALSFMGLGHALFTVLLRQRSLLNLLRRPTFWLHLLALPAIIILGPLAVVAEILAAVFKRGGAVTMVFKRPESLSA